MIYSDTGIIVNNRNNLEAFDFIMEATSDPEIESKLQTLKDAIKECSPESLSNIKSDDKKYHFLTDKIRKVLGSMSFISSLGIIGSIAGLAINEKE